MSSDRQDIAGEDELAESHDRKQEQVLQREGLEEELMQAGRSDEGEQIDSVE